MIKAINAYTNNIESPEFAVSEIREQLNWLVNKRANAVGIVTCHSDFLDNGTVELLAQDSPFDIVGITTIFSGSQSHNGAEGLTLQVLTSDEEVFVTKFSEPLTEDSEAGVKRAYKEAVSEMRAHPTMMFTFAPLPKTVPGDDIVRWLDEISDGVPNFGALAIDSTLDFSQSRSIFNGDYSWNRIALVLVYGNVSPRFLVSELPEINMLPGQGVVTGANVNVLTEVDGAPLLQYLDSLGLISEGMITIEDKPFFFDSGDGSKPIARALLFITDEGNGVLGGRVHVGDTIRIGVNSYEDVVNSAKLMFDTAFNLPNVSNIVSCSCMSRFFCLGENTSGEIDMAATASGGNVPFIIGYTGGEICPVPTATGESVNRFHNFTLTACVF
ncbi:MAG: FIST C-terminal domain-containing protein [Clostridiales Family XIII bacterium]|jgi:hypothetical protein|nr:FIST C-terminal domain-containing protein [Clostridiales Family XIII bacterium]